MGSSSGQPPAYPLLAYPALDSTNDEVRRQAALGGEDGLVITADTQSAGRGRSGRFWQSPEGNLHLSMLMRPVCSPERATELPFVVALAVAEAVAGLVPVARAVRCKWPNDVLIDDRKVAGVLIESEMRPEGGVDWIAVGIGVNVAMAPGDDEVIFPATCLSAAGGRDDGVASVRDAVVDRLYFWRRRWEEGGFAPIRRAWLGVAWRLGAPLAVRMGDDRIEGIFSDLDVRGALILQSADGLRVIPAGDVLPQIDGER